MYDTGNSTGAVNDQGSAGVDSLEERAEERTKEELAKDEDVAAVTAILTDPDFRRNAPDGSMILHLTKYDAHRRAFSLNGDSSSGILREKAFLALQDVAGEISKALLGTPNAVVKKGLDEVLSRLKQYPITHQEAYF